MKKSIIFCIGFLFVLLAGCSTSPKFIVDYSNYDRGQFEADLAECEALAAQVDTQGDIMTGALVGATMGGVLGGISDPNTGRGVRDGVGVGAVVGALSGGGSSFAEKRQIERRCLENRGYEILN